MEVGEVITLTRGYPEMKILILIAFFATGCASVAVQNTPTFYDWETGKKINFTSVTLTEVSAFAPTTTVKIVLQCEPLDEHANLANSKCRPAAVGRQDSAPGVVAGFGAAVINSAAIVGAAHLIGKGISESGDRSTTTNSNDESIVLQTGQNATFGDDATNLESFGGTQNVYN